MSVGRKPVIKEVGIENIRVLCEGDTIKQLVFPHPTVSEILREAIFQF